MKFCWIIVLFALVLSAQARLPRKSSSTAEAGSTASSLESEQQPQDRNPKAQAGIGGSEEGSSPGEDSDEEENPLFLRRERNPFSILDSLLNMHLGNGRNAPGTSVIRIQPMSPSYNPFSFYPSIRHPSILGNNNPFDLPAGFPEFPRFGHFPEIAHPSLFDMHDEKVPEGYEKVKESIEGPEGHQMIRTTYEKKNTDGPNQFYGIIVKMRPYKPEGSKSDVKPSRSSPAADKPEGASSNEDEKKQADRRVAGERNHEVEESVLNSATEQPSKEEEETKTSSEDKQKESVKPSSRKPSTTAGSPPAKKDTETVTPKDKPASENEIPKSDEAPTITVNDNNGSE